MCDDEILEKDWIPITSSQDGNQIHYTSKKGGKVRAKKKNETVWKYNDCSKIKYAENTGLSLLRSHKSFWKN